ncbi:MAG: hypothetical protein IAA89_06815 [Firmicutes bacterium]|uniref:Uncharacterized protein n=1 Tax=Candidatus Gallilactobacillus intestinavium TaxID=2840838 RepID=A0A9D9E8P3_9LACO|nr:hypothetical protein [Candidatus Gallilactobacillus intestinavium]
MKLNVDPGTDAFENAIFILNKPLTSENKEDYVFQGGIYPEPMDQAAWAMPAYLSDDFNLFFVFARNYQNKWTITFSKVEIEDDNRIVAMSKVVPTGTGFNAIARLNHDAALEILTYLETLESQKIGHWELGK